MSVVFAQLLREFYPEKLGGDHLFSMRVGIQLTDGFEKYLFRADLDALVQHFQPRRGEV